MQSNLSATGRFPTRNASKYLQQLCKHFAHKVAVSYDEKRGTAALPPGPCTLWADESGLSIEIAADDEAGLTQAKFIVDDHLQRFAFREAFTSMGWR